MSPYIGTVSFSFQLDLKLLKTETVLVPHEMATTNTRSESGLTNLGPCRSWKAQQEEIEKSLPAHDHNHPRRLLAQFDDETITVYQAYKPTIGLHAVSHGHFAECEFSFSRMTWIKPNFSWMMYRCGWGSKKNQEIVLAIKLWRSYFDALLTQAVSTSWDQTNYHSECEWRKAIKGSDVIVQWDPDHDLISGHKLPYRVIQLGVRGLALEGFKGAGICSICDITAEVRSLRSTLLDKHSNCTAQNDVDVPLERQYPVSAAVSNFHRFS